jgi:hypothetical protein
MSSYRQERIEIVDLLTCQARDHLDRLQSHQRPDHPRHTPNNPFLLTSPRASLSPRDPRPDTPVTRALLTVVVNGKLAVEAESSTRDKRLVGEDAGVGDEVAG